MIVAASNAKLLWYVTRGSGVVALLLLTASVLLGIVGALRWRGERWPRFAVTAAHRNLTLLSVLFVAVHVVTTVADGYAPIGLTDAVVPFLSPYRPVWLGLGAVSFDLLLALVATSLLRSRLAPRAWRAVHWLAYASWPVALLHSLGTGSDARFGWMAVLGLGCLGGVAMATLLRAWLGAGPRSPRLAGAAAALLVPVVIFAWYRGGPLRHGWAARAGTPTRLVANSTAVGTSFVHAGSVTPPTSFGSRLTGTLGESRSGDGLVIVTLTLRLHGTPGGAARIDLRGIPSDDGVSMTASGVSFVPASTRAVYTGNVTGLAGSDVVATVADGSGDRLRLHFSLTIDTAAQTVSGTVRGSTPA
jgi:sulfoxide reductase heme-binding subunit YedZ